MTGTPSILLLAAGASRRMQGRDKLLQNVYGTPLLRHICQQALATGLPCTVTLPDPDHPRAAVIADLAVSQIFIPDAAQGMAASIRAGIDHLAGTNASAVLICPTDLPDLRIHHFNHIAQATADTSDTIIRAQSRSGGWGHPIAFPRKLFAALQTAKGDQGPKHLFQTHPVQAVQFDDMAPTTDLDTPDDWNAWRRNTQG